MTLLDSTTPTNKASRGDRATKMSTNKLSMIAFTGVKTLARTISPNDRTGEGGAALVRPSALRSSTSAEASPTAGSTATVSKPSEATVSDAASICSALLVRSTLLVITPFYARV